MLTTKTDTSKSITDLLNGIMNSIKTVVPIEHLVGNPSLLSFVEVQFGVLIGFTGDVRGRLLLKGNSSIFSAIGRQMFGMTLEGEMLSSFAGELGNMIAGNIATNISINGLIADITAPTVLEGNTKLAGFNNAIKINISFEQVGELQLILIIDK